MSPSQRYKEHSARLLESALLSVSARILIQKKITLDNNILGVSGNRFDLDRYNNIHLLGLGKGAASLCSEFERTTDSRVAGGVVVSVGTFQPENKNILFLRGDHPVPGKNSEKAGKILKHYAENIQKDDLVLAFITGGASAMAVAPVPGISLEELTFLNRLLVRCGADIGEINTVRKHLSAIKGGMLAKKIYPATSLSFILSDVIGSDPGTIGSGPLYGDRTTFSDALTVLKKYKIDSQCSHKITGYLEKGAKGLEEETPGPEDKIFENNHTCILGNNRDALEGAASEAEALGYRPDILPAGVRGDVGSQAPKIARLIKERAKEKGPEGKIILFGGEYTVSFKGEGKGGRVQEFLLLLLQELQNVDFPFFVAGAGTDGLDGNSEDAGAWIDHRTTEKMGQNPDREIRDHLARNDSNTFFRNLNQHIHTGVTGTNVMDIFMVFV